MTTHRENLLTLHSRVDAFFEGVFARQGANMACRAGCSGCCQQSLTVFTVEMERILEAVDQLPPPARERLRARVTEAASAGLPVEQQPCVLLEDDRCVVYEARPTLCRTHGAPIRMPREVGGGRDVCPLSFTSGAPSLDELPSSDVLDIDRVNQALALIEHLRGQDSGEAGGRVDITTTLAHHL